MLVYSPFKSCLPALKFAPLLLGIAEPLLSTKIIMADVADHLRVEVYHIKDLEESFVPKTFETEEFQNCSTPNIKTGTEKLSGSVGYTSD